MPATYSSGPVEWRVELAGEAHPLLGGDGVVVGIAASQPESPPIDLTWRHSCPVPTQTLRQVGAGGPLAP